MDAATRDDAAVFRVSDDRALVATVDFFAPVVDDPYDFGAIAAANAFSDLYAMGATPLFALNILAWPREPDLFALLEETARGGADVARAAGALILGGHSIDDPEPKYGMVALGDVHPQKVITNAGARPGDRLILTKAIGTGILSTALKQDLATEREIEPAVRSMRTLNAAASQAMRAVGEGAHAATDVSGFGLIGHLRNLLVASRKSARLFAGRVPIFPRAQELAARGAIAGGTHRNRSATDPHTTYGANVAEVDRVLLNDAQTSGGLLIAVDSTRAGQLVAELRRAGPPVTAEDVGEVVEGDEARVTVLAGEGAPSHA